MAPKLFVPKERAAGETRVAATPDSVKRLIKLGFEVVVEAGAGGPSHILDTAYSGAGATLTSDVAAGWSSADVVIKVGPPLDDVAGAAPEAGLLKEGAILV